MLDPTDITKVEQYVSQGDKASLEVGWLVNDILLKEMKEARVKEDHGSGLSYVVSELAQALTSYFPSEDAARTILIERARIARFFTRERVDELKQYHLTFSAMRSVYVGNGAECDEAETEKMLGMFIENKWTPKDSYDYKSGRLTNGDKLRHKNHILTHARKYVKDYPEDEFSEKLKGIL